MNVTKNVTLTQEAVICFCFFQRVKVIFLLPDFNQNDEGPHT